MKKISILTLAVAATVFILLTVCMDGKAQSESEVRKTITENYIHFVRWFNTGEVDSLLTLYADDACLVGHGCGKTYIRDFFRTQMSFIKFEDKSSPSV